MHKIKIPSKGNITKASQNEVDKNTKGPFLIKLCDEVKSFPVVAKKPTLNLPEIAVDLVEGPNVYNLDVTVPEVTPTEVN